MNTTMTIHISKKDHKFIDMAAQCASHSTLANKHGCILEQNGKVISHGFNSNRCADSTGLIEGNLCCHAEIAAIMRFASSQKQYSHHKYWVQGQKSKKGFEKDYIVCSAYRSRG